MRYLRAFRKSAEKTQVSLKFDKNNGYFTVLIISHLFLLILRNVSDKSCREDQNTHFMIINFKENRAIYEIMRKNIVRVGRATDDNMAHAYCTLGI